MPILLHRILVFLPFLFCIFHLNILSEHLLSVHGVVTLALLVKSQNWATTLRACLDGVSIQALGMGRFCHFQRASPWYLSETSRDASCEALMRFRLFWRCSRFRLNALQLPEPIIEMLIGPDIAYPAQLPIKVSTDLGRLAALSPPRRSLAEGWAGASRAVPIMRLVYIFAKVVVVGLLVMVLLSRLRFFRWHHHERWLMVHRCCAAWLLSMGRRHCRH